jgi:hypothetical protein
MQIMLVLFLLAVAGVLGLGGAFVISLVVGIVVSRTGGGKPFAPIFLLMIPSAAIGALSGGVAMGCWAVQHNDNLILLGPLGGIVIGGAIGLLAGTTLAAIWWLCKKTPRQVQAPGADKPDP